MKPSTIIAVVIAIGAGGVLFAISQLNGSSSGSSSTDASTSARTGVFAKSSLNVAPDAALNQPSAPPTDMPSSGDPYAAGQQALKARTNSGQRDVLLEKAKRIYFAATCKVLSYPSLTGAIVNGEAEIYLQQVYGVATNMSDETLAGDITAAEKSGVAQGQQPGACDYWKEDPQAVADMRQEADLMLQMR